MQGHMIALNLTGRGVIYPGHPLVLATIIMQVFENFEEANAPTEHGWCQALSDSRVPGAGDHVGSAMRTLEIGFKGGTVCEMVDHTKRYWVDGSAGGHHKNVEPGNEQAQAFEQRFRELAQTWFAKPQPAADSAPKVRAGI